MMLQQKRSWKEFNTRACISGEKKSQSQNSMQHFEFYRTFLTLLGLPFCPTGRYCSTASAEKKCGKIQNDVWSSDFQIFSPKMHALVNYLDFALDRLGVVSSAMKRCLCLKEEALVKQTYWAELVCLQSSYTADVYLTFLLLIFFLTRLGYFFLIFSFLGTYLHSSHIGKW